MGWDGAAAEQWVTVLSLILYKHHYTTTLLWVCLFSLLPSHNNTTELQAADSHIIKCHTPLHTTALYGPAQWRDFSAIQHSTPTPPPKRTQLCHSSQHRNIALLYYKLYYICKCAQSNFELQAKEVKNVRFGRIWSFHKNPLIYLNASNSNQTSMVFIWAFSERSTFFSAHFWMTTAASHHKLCVYCCKVQNSRFVNIYIEFSMTWVQTCETWFSNRCCWKQSDCPALTDICKLQSLSASVQSPYNVIAIYIFANITNIICYMNI